MKNILLWLFCATIALGQATPPGYLYTKPLPASGATPPSYITVSQVLNPSDYSDPRPLVWSTFVGGGWHSVASTAERDSLIASRRMEGMGVYVAANKHIYILDSDLTSWIDLGAAVTDAFGPTIYKGNGTLTGNRVVSGGGFNLDFPSYNSISFSPVTSWTASSAITRLNGSTSVQINNSGAAPFYFLNSPPVAASGHYILAIDPATRNVSYSPSVTIGNITAPATIYTANGSLAGNRVVSGSGANSLSFSGLTTFGVGSSTASIIASGSRNLTITPTDVSLVTTKVIAGTATNGFVPMLSNASTGVFDWALSTNLYNADGTLLSDRTVTGAGKNLTFEGINDLQLNPTNSLYIGQVFNPTTNWPRTRYVYISGTSGTYVNWFETNYYSFPAALGSVPGATNEDGIMVGGNGGHTVAQTRSRFPAGGSQDYVYVTTNLLDDQQHSNGKIWICDSPSTINVLIRGGTSTFPDGGRAEFFQKGAGIVNIIPTNGLTLRSFQSITGTYGQNSAVSIRREGTNLWIFDEAVTGGGGGSTIYAADGTLAGNRTVAGGGNSLTFSGNSTIAASALTSIAATAPTITHIASTSYRVQTPATASGAAESGMFMQLANNATGDSDYAAAWYKGTAAGTAGVFTIANADLVPDYDSAVVPPEFTVLYVKFPEAASGGDTLQMGPSSPVLAIERPDGTPVQAGDFSNAKVVTLVRSGITSGSKWILQLGAAASSPSAPNVTEVDDTGDLAGETAAVVITLGYTAAHDGGGATYRADASSAATVDGVKVFTRTAGGRYLLQNAGTITAKQAGLAANGTTDDTARMNAFLAAAVGSVARFEPANYRTIGKITIPAGSQIEAEGASLWSDTTATQAYEIKSFSKITGGHWAANHTSGAFDNGFNNSCFTIGNYVSSGSESNIVIRNVQLMVTNYSASGLFIAGGSYNITGDNISMGDSAVMDDLVAIHWGYVSGSEVNGTLHPHDINLRNLKAGKLTGGSGLDASVIFVAAGYAINVDGFQSEECRHGIVSVAGDFGFKYSGFAAQNLGAVTFKNGSSLKCNNLGILSQGVGVSAQIYPQKYVYENCTFIGLSSSTAGSYHNSSRDTSFRDCVFNGFAQGTVFTGGSRNAKYDHCTFATNLLTGIEVNDSTSKLLTFVDCNVFNNGRNFTGNNANGIQLLAGSMVTVERCVVGNPDTEPNQEVGIKVVAPFVGATLIGNHIANVKGGGVNQGIYLGGASDLGQLGFVNLNTAASGITLYANGAATQWIPGAYPNCISKVGDANYTYLPHQHCRELLCTTTITTARAMTLSTTGAIAGETVTFTRTDLGVSTFTFAGKPMPGGSFATAIYDGATWVLYKYGTL